jgi:protein-S-isoprenylcysteine O-methyltransferase Ste14
MLAPGGFILSALVTLVGFPAVILLAAGDWRWLEGWIFGLWLDAMVLSNMVYLYRKDPALLAERSRRPGSANQQRWDAYLLTGIYALAIVWLLIMPLDAKRFGWSPPFPVWVQAVGALALVPALYLIYRATVENTYLSTLVRIQAERGQRVISTGVYGFVRHPLYLGCLLMIFGAPLLLGSVYGLLIGFVGLIALVGRIIGEERTLVRELDGYEEYRRNVRYRLVPFIW